MTRLATIVVPTYDNAHTLYASVGSALNQTVEDIEIFIVGDGVPDVTREIVRDLASDPRVRFFDNPKGERTGEPWRHQALAEAAGEIVSYLSDDDIYLPEHVATMKERLENNDFVHAPTLRVIGGRFDLLSCDLSDPLLVELTSRLQFYRFGLSHVAHTLDFYRRLPFGWRTTPAGTPTDQYMWQQCMAVEGVKAACTFRPTVLNFPANERKAMSTEERRQELASWLNRLSDPENRKQYERDFQEAAIACSARELSYMRNEIIKLTDGWSVAVAENKRLESELAAIHSGATWKLRRLLLSLIGRR